MRLETMTDFFTARVDAYDRHMLEEVEGCREGYERMAALLPDGISDLLDLGCGTGLELGPIFRRFPALRVTGIDLTQAMLDRLRAKFPGKALRLVCGSYLDVPFGECDFDAAVSFQTLHHLHPKAKIGLYRRLHRALRDGGVYLECDYMVTEQAEEDFYFAENARLRRQANLPDGVFAHYDTPCTLDHQRAMLEEAGFSAVALVWRRENTTLLAAKK